MEIPKFIHENSEPENTQTHLKIYQTVKIKVLLFHSINESNYKRDRNLHIGAHKSD